MPRSKEDDAARKREARSVAFQSKRLPRSKEDDAARKREKLPVALRAQAAAKQTAQGVVQPTNDAERKRREREDAAQIALPEAAKKRKLQDAERKRRERDDAAQAQAAAKQIAQGVVQPTSEAERKRRERQDAAQMQAAAWRNTGRVTMARRQRS